MTHSPDGSAHPGSEPRLKPGSEAILRLQRILDRLDVLGPGGHAMALHVDFTTPRYLLQSYSKEWAAHYAAHGLVMKDPAVRWGLRHDGIAEHDLLVEKDEHGVFEQAKAFGLNHWAVVATSAQDSKSIGAFARAQEPFSDEDRLEARDLFEQLHELTALAQDEDPALDAHLRQLSVRQTH